ncbi:MAG: hypothetical protein M3M85_01005 [bacterium]|nr:hypothetical protein [bacterium]
MDLSVKQRLKLVWKEIGHAYYASLDRCDELSSTGIGLLYFFAAAVTSYWLAWGNKWWGNGKVSIIAPLILDGLAVLVLLMGWFIYKNRQRNELGEEEIS